MNIYHPAYLSRLLLLLLSWLLSESNLLARAPRGPLPPLLLPRPPRPRCSPSRLITLMGGILSVKRRDIRWAIWISIYDHSTVCINFCCQSETCPCKGEENSQNTENKKHNNWWHHQSCVYRNVSYFLSDCWLVQQEHLCSPLRYKISVYYQHTSGRYHKN